MYPAGGLLLGDGQDPAGHRDPDRTGGGAARRHPGADLRPEQAERPNTRFQRRYIVCAVVCILAFLVWCVLELTLAPYLSEQLLRKGYLFWPSYVYGITGALFVYKHAI